LSDALRRLDFRSAVHDHRRFPYTAKLLELLLSQQRITTLSGLAQKSVLNVLEEIAVQGDSSHFFKITITMRNRPVESRIKDNGRLNKSSHILSNRSRNF